MENSTNSTYDEFANLIYEDYTKYKTFCLENSSIQRVYDNSEQICFYENLTSYLIKDKNIEREFSVKQAKKIKKVFKNTILKSLYLFFVDGDYEYISYGNIHKFLSEYIEAFEKSDDFQSEYKDYLTIEYF